MPSARTTAGHEREVAEQWVEMGHEGRHTDGRVAEGRGDLELTQERGGTSQVLSVAGGLCGRCEASMGEEGVRTQERWGREAPGTLQIFRCPSIFLASVPI